MVRGNFSCIRKTFIEEEFQSTLKDYLNEDFKGTFYQPEVQKVELRESDVFKVENILKTKGRGRNKQFFEKWL